MLNITFVSFVLIVDLFHQSSPPPVTNKFKQAISEIESLGGVIEVQPKDQFVLSLELESSSDLTKALLIAKQLPLTTLIVSGSGFADEHAPIVRHFSELSSIFAAETALTDSGVKAICGAKSIRNLDLASTKVTDGCFLFLASLPDLEHVDLSRTKVTGRELQVLKNCVKLRALTLAFCRLSDEGFNGLGQLTRLRKLNLDTAKIADRNLEDLGKLGNLEFLDLEGKSILGSGLKYLATLSKLKRLSLNRDYYRTFNVGPIKTSDADIEGYYEMRRSMWGAMSLEDLPALDSLEELDLIASQLSRKSVERIALLPNLRILDLQGSSVNDEDVAILVRCKSLKQVFVDYSKVTDRGKMRLREALGRDVILSRSELLLRRVEEPMRESK